MKLIEQVVTFRPGVVVCKEENDTRKVPFFGGEEVLRLRNRSRPKTTIRNSDHESHIEEEKEQGGAEVGRTTNMTGDVIPER